MLRTIRTLSAAAASALGVLAFDGAASAEQPSVNLGPVGAYEPIVATFGDKRVLAFYQPDGGNCAVSAIVTDASPADADRTSTRVRVSLHPGELFHLDSVENQNVILTCGPNAAMLMVLNRGELLTQSASVN
ncbi:MAG: hypothetical protein R3D30_09870 [Hyphomicrobiales bacterium]